MIRIDAEFAKQLVESGHPVAIYQCTRGRSIEEQVSPKMYMFAVVNEGDPSAVSDRVYAFDRNVYIEAMNFRVLTQPASFDNMTS